MAVFQFQDKYACGAFFNMARDNFHRTFMDILHKVGFRKNYDETGLDDRIAEIIEALKGNPSAIVSDDAKKLIAQQSKIRQHLFRSFPILAPVMADVLHYRHVQKEKKVWDSLKEEERSELKKIKEKEKSEKLSEQEKHLKKKIEVNDDGDRDASCVDCLETLLMLGRCLTDCRNYYTHYRPFNPQEKLEEMYNRQVQVGKWLFSVFTASRRLDKKRNRLSSAEMEFITNNNMKLKTDENGNKEKNDEGKDIYTKNHDYYFSVIGESYITKTIDGCYEQRLLEGENTVFGIADNNALSDFGLFYLCCCFITRTQAQLFAEKVRLFEGSPENMTANEFNYVWNVSQVENPNIIQRNELERLKKKLKIEKLSFENEDDIQKFNTLRADTTYWVKSPENDIILEILSIYRVRLPKGKRFGKQDNCSTVALDMLNELCRCPRELYSILSPEGQDAFEDPVDAGNGGTNATTDRIRYTDRFPFLALRAIDEMNMLPSIRFQIQLGYYRFSFYDKVCIDGSEQLRRIGKSLNGFGRLSAIENQRKQRWAPSNSVTEIQEPNKMQRKVYSPTLLEDGKTTLDLLRPVEDKVGNNPYITDCTAYYNIHNNRIGLYWELDGKRLNRNDVLVFPDLQSEETGKTNHRKATVAQKAPLCSLSVRELPALLFLYHLNNGNGVEIENIIIKKYNGLLQFFKDLSRVPSENNTEPTFETIKNDVVKIGLENVLSRKRYGLVLSDIPDRLRKCLPMADVSDETVFGDCEIVSYFKDLLDGTKYALADDVTEEIIKELIHSIGYAKSTEGVPARLLKKQPVPLIQIMQSGIETLMKCKGKKPDDLPKNIYYFVFSEAEAVLDSGQKQTSADNNSTFNRFRNMLLGNGDKNEGRLERRFQRVDRQLSEFKKSLSAQFSKDNRYGTKSYKDVRYGRLAEILAESMLMWQPTKESDNPIERGQNKLTGLNYRCLVDFLATYNYQSTAIINDERTVAGIEALKHILTEAHLIGSDTPHPFLEIVLTKTPNNIEELFHIYMECEKNKILEVEKTFKNLSDATPLKDAIAKAPAFVHPKRERWSFDNSKADDVRKIAANYIKPGNTLFLPDGLFTDEIVRQLGLKGFSRIIEKARAQKEPQDRNVSFYISHFLEETDDHCQSFYDGNTKQFYRGYELFKKLKGKKQGNERLHKYLSRTEIALILKAKDQLEDKINDYCKKEGKPDAKEGMMRDINKIKKTERTILRYKIQDIVLFWTAKKMLQKQLEMRDRNIVIDERQNRENLGRLTLAAQNRRMALAQQRQERINQMKLKNIFDGDALNVTMDYEYKIDVHFKKLDEQGREIVVKQGRVVPYNENGELTETGGQPIVYTRKVYITQENVTVKNFGRIFRVIKDERLEDLLVLLITKREGRNPEMEGPDYFVSAAELANEFAQFDNKRIEAFEIIHGLEKTAYPRLKDPHSGETFQFKNMMRLICSEEEADAVNQYRKSFAHSKYDVKAENFGNGISLEVPVVSEIMKEEMQTRSDMIKKNINSSNSNN